MLIYDIIDRQYSDVCLNEIEHCGRRGGIHAEGSRVKPVLIKREVDKRAGLEWGVNRGKLFFPGGLCKVMH